MAEVYKKSVRKPGQTRRTRGKVPTTLRSDLKSDIDPSTYANPAGSQATKRVQTGWPYKEDKSFAGKPKTEKGTKKDPFARKITTSKQPEYKRYVPPKKDKKKPESLGKEPFARRYPSKKTTKGDAPLSGWSSDFSKWLDKTTTDVGKSASTLWSQFTKQFDGEAPKSPPPSARARFKNAVKTGKKVGESKTLPKKVTKKRVSSARPSQSAGMIAAKNRQKAMAQKLLEEDKAVNVAKKTGESKTLPKRVTKKKPYQKMDAPGKAMPPPSPVAAPKKLAKETTKKKDISEAEANRRIAAREEQIKRERAAEASKKKKAAPSVDGRTKAVQDKEESMAGFAGDKPKEETADFKDFLSKHGGVKGFQFNLVGKNKTKEAGMKRAREAYAEEQRDRKKPGQSDHYQYGEGRRAVKKKGGAMRKSQGGTIRLKTGGAVIDTYDYN